VERLVLHIERLLLTNDCVMIPEVGGFVLHPCPAIYLSDEHKFIPPSKAIVFNPNLNHADRLLPQSYMQLHGMTWEEAQRSLQHDIEALWVLLNGEGAIHFGQTGVLRKGADGKLFFEAAQDTSFAGLKPFGLYPFHLPPMMRTEQPELAETAARIVQLPPVSKRVIYLPLNRKWIRAVGISAAAIGLFLIVSMPLKDGDHISCSAGLTPSQMLSQHTTDDLTRDTAAHLMTAGEAITQPVDSLQIAVKEIVDKQMQPPPATQPNNQQTQQPGIQRSVAQTTQQPVVQESVAKQTQPPVAQQTQQSTAKNQNQPVAQAPATPQTQQQIVQQPVNRQSQPSSTNPTNVPSQQTYYVIIGSFAAEKHALQFMQEINLPELTTMGIVKNEERARVYAAKFTSKDEAQRYLLQLKATPKLKDAWIYVVNS